MEASIQEPAPRLPSRGVDKPSRDAVRDRRHADRAPRTSRFAYGPAACLAWITAATLWIDFSQFHRWHQADSFVPVLQSIYRWEPFYWQQNRYGMLVALLAAPVRNPLHNLLVQNGLTIWLGLLSVPLAVRFLRGAIYPADSAPVRNSWRDGLFAAGAFALIAPNGFPWIYLSTVNVFGTAQTLGLMGLIALERPGRLRITAAVLLLATAAWVNTSIGALLFFLLAALVPIQRRLRRRKRHPLLDPHSAVPSHPPVSPSWERRVALQSMLCLGAVLVGLKVFARIPPEHYHNTHFAIPAASAWLRLLRTMWNDIVIQHPQWYAWPVFLGLVFTVLLAAARSKKPGAARSVRSLALIFLSMAAYSCAMGVMFNGTWRYAAPAIVLAHASAVEGLTRYLPPFIRRRAYLLPLLLLAAVPLRYGLPSYHAVRHDIESTVAVGYHDLVDARCTHVAGDYWRVWPAVFGANWRLHEEGGERTVWGLAHRSLPTRDLWQAVPRNEVRAATFVGDPDGASYLRLLAPEWHEQERRGPLTINVIR